MIGREYYSKDNFFGRYESLIHKKIGVELDDHKRLLDDIGNQCGIKLISLPPSDKMITVDELLNYGSDRRKQIISTLLYDDALWRLESAHLMISIGLLNVAYANMRESLETLIYAFIIERDDREAIKFLLGNKLNPKLISEYITPEYNNWLHNMRRTFSDWGVHTKFQSVQLTSLFGPGRFNRILSEVPTVNRELNLPEGFIDAASNCLSQEKNLMILFQWLMEKPITSAKS